MKSKSKTKEEIKPKKIEVKKPSKTVKTKKIVQEVEDGGGSKYYKCVQRVVSSVSNVTHWVFNDVDEPHKVDFFTQKGTRLLVARYPDFYKIYLYKTHRAGEPSWPNGGVMVYNANYETMQYFYYDSVAIHPEGGMYKFQT
jgi:hypothetical protein